MCIVNPPDILLLAARAARRNGASSVFDQHDLVPETTLSHFPGNKILYRASLASEQMASELLDVVLVTTDSYWDVALTRGHEKKGEVYLVRNAPDPECSGRSIQTRA